MGIGIGCPGKWRNPPGDPPLKIFKKRLGVALSAKVWLTGWSEVGPNHLKGAFQANLFCDSVVSQYMKKVQFFSKGC